MAKKSRTPPPPRRVQAPKARTGPSAARPRRGLVLGIAAALVVVAAAAAVGFFVLGGGGGEDALAQAGCTAERFPSQGNEHVEELPEDFERNSVPPTTGPHHPIPAPFDAYDEPVAEIHLVHSLEHGGVAVQYGDDVPQATVDAIVGWYRDDPNGLIVAPLPELGAQVALAAWFAEQPGTPGEGVVARCDGFDEAAFDAFLDRYGFQGPERFPREEMTPGSA